MKLLNNLGAFIFGTIAMPLCATFMIIELIWNLRKTNI